MCNRFPTETVRQCGAGSARLGLFGRSILAVWDGGRRVVVGGWGRGDSWFAGARGSFARWGGKSRGSQNRDSRYGSAVIVVRQVVYLDGVRRGWVCLVFFVLVVAPDLRSTHRARGRWRWMGGRHSIFRIWTFVSGAFVSSLPQVVGVGGGWRRDVVVRVSLSCFEVS